ncbi:CoA-transferase family III domain-containing protein [Podospora conica]|nr:CoA-transferase family III domain-containing protein [Schizothecium conicum]
MNPTLSVPWRLSRMMPTLRVRAPVQFATLRRFTTSPRPNSLPLEGYRVLDMTRVLAGPYCTQILGDLGAEVIKIEHPTRGDDTRAWGPPYAKYKPGSSEEGPGESAYFLGVNRNKKSLALSFQDPAGVEILHRLAAKCDILVENYIPGALKKYGMDYDTIHKINPGLIYASITGYGQTGPYSQRAGYDVMVEAEFGLMHITGNRDGPPVKVGVAVTDLTTGLYTSNAIMAALLSRAKTGRGQHIDAALSDCQTATLANIASSCLVSGEKDTGRWGTAHPSIVPYKSFQTKDGDILFGGGNDRLFGILCDGLGRPEWKENPKYQINAQRVAHRNELEAEIEKITVTKTTQEWLDVFDGKGMPYAAVNDVLSTLTHEHTLARNMVVEIEHPACGPLKVVNSPVKYSETKPTIRSPPPMLGEHTEEVLTKLLGMGEDAIWGLREKGVGSAHGAVTTPSPAPSMAPSNTAAGSPAASRRYVPQFSAATQLILKRIKGDPTSLSSALAVATGSTSIATKISKSSYDDVKRRLVMGMATSTSMTMQMPVATAALPAPSTPVTPSGAGPSHLPKPATAGSSKPAVSAIRMISSGLTASGKVSTAKPQPAARKAPQESKAKKTKPPAPPKPTGGAKRKRAKGKDGDDRSISSSSEMDEPAPPAPDSAAPTPPLTMTKSGRQVQKPETYNPATVDAHTKKRANYGKRTAEQALCKHCSRLHSPASNQIVFCDGCNDPWHQFCHDPWIDNAVVQDASKSWFCGACTEKRNRHQSKRQKVAADPPKPAGPPPRESWAAKTPQQQRAYLLTLSSQELVGLVMTSLELHPDLPIFPAPVPPPAPVEPTADSPGPAGASRSLFSGSTTEGLFPRVDANPTGQMNFVRKTTKNKGGKDDKGNEDDPEDEVGETDPLVALWPKPGKGMFSRMLQDEEAEFMEDDDDYEAFSVILYDDKGKKIEENGIKVGKQ